MSTVPLEDRSQIQIEKMLEELCRQSATCRRDLRTLARDAGTQKSRYRSKRSSVMLALKVSWPASDKMTVDLLEAKTEADPEVGEARDAAYIAEALFDAERTVARLIAAEMSSLQSILADLRPMVSERVPSGYA